MSAIIKHTNKGFCPAIESNQVKSYANDPFVIKKVEKAIETLKKVGLPGKSLLKLGESMEPLGDHHTGYNK